MMCTWSETSIKLKFQRLWIWHVYRVYDCPVVAATHSKTGPDSKHWFTTSFLWRKVPESDARSMRLGLTSDCCWQSGKCSGVVRDVHVARWYWKTRRKVVEGVGRGRDAHVLKRSRDGGWTIEVERVVTSGYRRPDCCGLLKCMEVSTYGAQRHAVRAALGTWVPWGWSCSCGQPVILYGSRSDLPIWLPSINVQVSVQVSVISPNLCTQKLHNWKAQFLSTHSRSSENTFFQNWDAPV